MKISNIALKESSRLIKVTAQILYEDSDLPSFELFFETDVTFRESFWPDPNALLLAAILPAWQAAERRIYLDGAVCPVLSHDIFAAMRVLSFWSPELGPPPAIEAQQFVTRRPQGSAVSLLSCGVDSLATLRQNKLSLPSNHPLSINTVIPVVFAKEAGDGISHSDAGRLKPARNVAADLRIELAPVWTNLWWLVDDGYFFDLKWHGALFAAVASLFSSKYSGGYLASSFDGGVLLKPWGSGPLLDPYYSSAHFSLHHHGAGMSRFQKTALVADWPAGLDNLRVCQRDSTGQSNCGSCEKCIRVMTSLVALGKLDECAAFRVRSVSAELLHSLKEWDMINDQWTLDRYTELAPLLSSRGRKDLAEVIEDFAPYFAEKGLPDI